LVGTDDFRRRLAGGGRCPRNEDLSAYKSARQFSSEGGSIMLSWSITFLIIGLVAGLLGVSGVAGAATQIAYVLFVVFLITALVSFVMGRRPPA
jgi:uncharacterized membrane protein YtjA (UPF0391 family)